MTPYRALVTGSRDWTDWECIYTTLDEISLRCLWVGRRLVVVHGACRSGADADADRWAVANAVAVERHPALWREHGVYNPQAGLVRNRLMVDRGADVCLAFIKNGSRGATHCADLAREAGIPVRRYVA